MRRFVFVVVCLFFVQLAQAAAIDKLHRFLDSMKTLRADFAQIVVAKNGKKSQQSTGVMTFSPSITAERVVSTSWRAVS